jgi:hypothetical protein
LFLHGLNYTTFLFWAWYLNRISGAIAVENLFCSCGRTGSRVKRPRRASIACIVFYTNISRICI